MAILIISALTFAIPPTAIAPSTPTPGYAIIQNNMMLSGTECVGGASMQYNFLAVDRSFMVRYEHDAECGLHVLFHEGTEPITVYAGGGSVTILDQHTVDGDDLTAHNAILAEWSGFPPNCGRIEASTGWGHRYDSYDPIDEGCEFRGWKLTVYEYCSGLANYCTGKWHESVAGIKPSGVTVCDIRVSVGGACIYNGSAGYDTGFLWDLVPTVELDVIPPG
ncbi:MAG: hypothetical protein ACLGIK_13330, partial [Gemmatimonadota bacterium]